MASPSVSPYLGPSKEPLGAGRSQPLPTTRKGHHSFLGSYFQEAESKEALGLGNSLAHGMMSTASTSTTYQDAVGARSMTPVRRKLRSQYPIDSPEPHVEFILVASFDVDRGSVMEFQYPSSISGDEHTLAELMLPDQVHDRSQDWTVFFLHKDSQAEPADGDDDHDDLDEKAAAGRAEQRRMSNLAHDDTKSRVMGETDEEAEEEDEKAIEGPPLIYVLNLVNTKHDETVRRGAIVKAMAICTRHPFLHIYKPLLLLALDTYFKAPTVETLAVLYEALNSMDLSMMPCMSLLERGILQATTVKDMFIEKFQDMIAQRQVDEADPLSIYHRVADEASPNPGTTTAHAPRLILPRDTHEFESKVFYNGISVPIKVPVARSLETVGDFSVIKLIQIFSTPHEKAPQPFPLHPHLTTGGPNTHPIIVLVNALLTQKRVIFLGHKMPSCDVADAVLASCALVSGGVLRGFIRHAFPYTDLTKVDDLLRVPGFVAGVTNQLFENKPEWWDLLCDLSTGRMTISKRIEQPGTSKGMEAFQQQNPGWSSAASMLNLQTQDSTGDQAFITNVLSNITSRLGEGVIRSMWRGWILKLIRIAAAFEECVYGVSALYIGGEEADAGQYGVRGHGYVWPDEASRTREMAGNLSRIEGWRATRTYYSLIQDLALLYTSRPIKGIDLHHQHDKLRTLKLSKDESAAIYLALDKAVHTPAEICQLLAVMPESHGGLFYLSLGLLHPRRDVRIGIVALLERIQEHEAGRHFWTGLGRFTKTAFARIKREMAAGDAATSDDDGGISKATTLVEQEQYC